MLWRRVPGDDIRGYENHRPERAIAERDAQSGKIKGGIRCSDAESLHVLRKAPLTPPGPFHPKAFRPTPLQIRGSFATNAAPVPKTLRRKHYSRSEDPSPRVPLQIRRPFAASAAPGPKTLRYKRCSRSEDPLLRVLPQARRPFAAYAPPGPRTPCCARRTLVPKRPLRNKKIHRKSNFLWIKR